MSFLYLLYKQYIHAYKSSVKQTAHSSNYKKASVQELLFWQLALFGEVLAARVLTSAPAACSMQHAEQVDCCV